MLIVLGFFKRRIGTSRDEFSAYWKDVHGPLIASIPGIERYLVRYVQHHLTPMPVTAHVERTELYDGFSEGWFVDENAFNAVQGSAFFSKICIDDEHKFLDMTATRWVIADTQVTIIPGPAKSL